jgi:hypothetical protein
MGMEVTFTPLHPDVISRLAQILAPGATRRIDAQKGLAERTEQSVSTGVLTTQEDPHDAQ